MRIIDKNRDYYDYLADPTDDVVFDRRQSFTMSKHFICNTYLTYYRRNEDKSAFILMQNGGTFWLMLAHFGVYANPDDFSIELIDSWKNYNKPNALMKINFITLKNDYFIYNYGTRDYRIDDIKSNLEKIRQMIDNNDFKTFGTLSIGCGWREHKNTYVQVDYNYPILIASGIPNIISAEDMYYAIEEYFSIEKTKSEKTVAEGTTNNDKIKNHGFDTKTSFRGKA